MYINICKNTWILGVCLTHILVLTIIFRCWNWMTLRTMKIYIWSLSNWQKQTPTIFYVILKDSYCTILTIWFYPTFGYCYCHHVLSWIWFIVIDLRLEKIKSSCRKKGITRSSALKDVRCTIVKVIVCILCKNQLVAIYLLYNRPNPDSTIFYRMVHTFYLKLIWTHVLTRTMPKGPIKILW